MLRSIVAFVVASAIAALGVSTLGASAAMAQGEDPFKDLVIPADTLNGIGTLLDLTTLVYGAQEKCSGFGSATTCGDGICRTQDKETVASCPEDCRVAPVIGWTRQTFCDRLQSIHEPATVDDVVQLIRAAAAQKQHVKVLGTAYSMSNIICTNGMVILTKNLNRIHGIEVVGDHDTVVVEPGVTLQTLNQWLYERGKTIGFSSIAPDRTTVGGVIGTASHGGSVKHNTVLSNQVEGVEIVAADGSVQRFEEAQGDTDTLKALRANLGLLGVVTKIRLRIEPTFNLHVAISNDHESHLLQPHGLLTIAERCDYNGVTWFPTMGRYVSACGVKTDAPSEPGAENILLAPRPGPEQILPRLQRGIHLGACYPEMGALTEIYQYGLYSSAPYLVKLDDSGVLVNTYEATGPVHRMISGDATPSPLLHFMVDYAYAIPPKNVDAVLAFLKGYLTEHQITLPINAVYMRYSPSLDRTLMAPSTAGAGFDAGEAELELEMLVYRPKGFSAAEREKFQAEHDRLAKLLITRFGARPHWGKSKESMFVDAIAAGVYGQKFARFNAVIRQLDPNGMFSNEWSTRIGFFNGSQQP